MKRILKIGLLLIVFGCFFIFLKATDISESMRLVRQLGVSSLWLLVVTFFSYFFGALGWKYCIDSIKKTSLLNLFMIRHVGNIITLFNPASAIAGELFNAKMLIRDGVGEKEAYKSVLLGRSLMILSQLILFMIVLFWFVFFHARTFTQEMHRFVFICFFTLLILVSGIVYLLLKEGKESQIPQTGDRWWYKLFLRIKEMRFLLSEYIRRRPKQTLLALLFFALQWVVGSIELYLILYFLHYGVDLLDALFLDTLIIILKSGASFIPGQLGVEELINKGVLLLIGISSASLWLSVSILRRARLLFWSGVASLFYIQLRRRKNRQNVPNGSIVRQS